MERKHICRVKAFPRQYGVNSVLTTYAVKCNSISCENNNFNNILVKNAMERRGITGNFCTDPTEAVKSSTPYSEENLERNKIGIQCKLYKQKQQYTSKW
jgi:hypothetical protein